MARRGRVCLVVLLLLLEQGLTMKLRLALSLLMQPKLALTSCSSWVSFLDYGYGPSVSALLWTGLNTVEQYHYEAICAGDFSRDYDQISVKKQVKG